MSCVDARIRQTLPERLSTSRPSRPTNTDTSRPESREVSRELPKSRRAGAGAPRDTGQGSHGRVRRQCGARSRLQSHSEVLSNTLRTCASKKFHPNGPAYSVEKAARAVRYLEWKDKSFQVGVSIGVVVVTARSGSRGEVMQELKVPLHCKDTACTARTCATAMRSFNCARVN